MSYYVSMAISDTLMCPANVKYTIMAFVAIDSVMIILIIVFAYQRILHRQQQHPKMHQDIGQSSMVSPKEEDGRREEGRIENTWRQNTPPPFLATVCIIGY